MMIDFNVPICIDTSFDYMRQAVNNRYTSGDGPYTKQCHAWIEQKTGTQKSLLTVSGTAALEMAVYLCDVGEGDEVIMPSYTFSSTACAVVGRGGIPVFVDIRPDTLNIDETKIEAAITDRTKALCVVHYAGVGCEMDAIMDIASRHNLKVIEDAAQGMMADYKGRALGTIGDFGCYSYHESKNYSMGEGGALLIRDESMNEPAEILREKGTNRSKFFRGQVDKYSWMDYGSSYLPSDLNAAFLAAQLDVADDINSDRLISWNHYNTALAPLAEAGKIELPTIPAECTHNAHIFYLKCRDLEQRTRLLAYMREHDIQAVYHYVPLHSAPAGIKYCRFDGTDTYTTRESERIARLPLYYGLDEATRNTVIESVNNFFEGEDTL